VVQSWRLWHRRAGCRSDPSCGSTSRIVRPVGVRPEHEVCSPSFRCRGGAKATRGPTTSPCAAPRCGIRMSSEFQEGVRDQRPDSVQLSLADAGRFGRFGRAVLSGRDAPRSGVAEVPLPEPVVLHTGVREALRSRRSSFGRFSGDRPIDAAQLATVLAASCTASGLDSDVAQAGAGPASPDFSSSSTTWTGGTRRVRVRQDSRFAALRPVRVPAEFLQQNYFLETTIGTGCRGDRPGGPGRRRARRVG